MMVMMHCPLCGAVSIQGVCGACLADVRPPIEDFSTFAQRALVEYEERNQAARAAGLLFQRRLGETDAEFRARILKARADGA